MENQKNTSQVPDQVNNVINTCGLGFPGTPTAIFGPPAPEWQPLHAVHFDQRATHSTATGLPIATTGVFSRPCSPAGDPVHRTEPWKQRLHHAAMRWAKCRHHGRRLELWNISGQQRPVCRR